METKLKEAIKLNLSNLVEFILKNHPNVDKSLILHKINNLFKLEQIHKKSILDTIEKKVIKVVKSLFSNYVLVMDTDDDQNIDLKINKFVLDIHDKTVVGVENSKNGDIEPLNKSLIEICHKYKLKYKLPLNLNIVEEEKDTVIVNEIQELGLKYQESDDDDDENED